MFCQPGRQVSASARPIISAAPPNATTVKAINSSGSAPRGSATFRIRSQRETEVSSIAGAPDVRLRFEVGGADLRVGEQLPAGAAERDMAVDHHVTAMRQAKRVIGVLLDQEHRDPLPPV